MEIQNSLRLIGEFLDVDRVTLMIHSRDGKYIDAPFIWLSDRLKSMGHDMPQSRNTIKLHEKLFKGEVFFFRSLDEVPGDWSNLRNYLISVGVKSALIMPLNVGGILLGGIAIDFIRMEYDWPDEIVKRLKFISDVFANALARKKSEEILQNTLIEMAQLKKQLEADCIYLQDEIKLEHNFDEIIGKSDSMRNILLDVEKVAPTNATVLILGETGTGKELFARAIHNASFRKERPMVKINSAALPSNLIESLLFGHIKGAFTGAQSNQPGRFEIANHGTLFLDEISELPLELQPKLLRVIQEGEFERLGSARTIKVDVRIIAATNRDIETEVQQGRFRKDLWYRLNVFPITIPPLRERKEDIPLLVNSFIKKFNRKHGKSIRTISQMTMHSLENYPWPGNVREMENVIERAVIICRNDKLQVDLPKTPHHIYDFHMCLEDVERDHIIMTLKKTKWRIAGPQGAANILRLHPNTLRSRMEKLGITKPWH
ncbi:MAG: sigma 54-interacting transcriptional regulator [Deltaproteobacteria bacterium]|nr:sigma 54-interacting transcriptional regulator [Deltaproteobacteria bacterium]